jgi:hypothetical protein
MSAFGGKGGHRDEQPECLLLTQSGHYGVAKILRWPKKELLSSRLLDQTRQGRVHHVAEVRGGETRAAELQLGDEAPEKDAAFLYR